MGEICPYCGRETGALKNHVRMSSGDGHGPRGEYPDGFDGESTPDPEHYEEPDPSDDRDGESPSSDGGGSGASDSSKPADPGADPTGSGETDDLLTFTPEEFDEIIHEIEDAAMARGYDAGRWDPHPDAIDTGPGTVDPTGAPPTCPECSGSMKTDIRGNSYKPVGASEGEYVSANDGDALCVHCGILIDGATGSTAELVAQ